jgi:hypothetical protein
MRIPEKISSFSKLSYILIFVLFGMFLGIVTILGISHSYSEKGLGAGIFATLFPPYALYMAHERFFIQDDQADAAIVLHLSSPTIGNTQVSFTNKKPKNIEECRSALNNSKKDILKFFKSNNPEFSDARLLKAECVEATDVQPRQIERPNNYVEPVVSLRIRLANGREGRLLYPTPTEGMSQKRCRDFFDVNENYISWTNFVHERLKAKNSMYEASKIVSVNCVLP